MPAEDKSRIGDTSIVAIEAPAITYEGVDMSRHDETYRRTYSLPGEIVRLDPASRVGGIHPDTIEEKVGREPRMVVATIVSGIEIDDPMKADGKFVRSVVQYELDGINGRHPARAFQPEGGHTQAYGVIMEHDGRTWLVQLDATLGHTVADDVVKATGPTREIVGLGGRHMEDFHDELHVDSFDGFREKVATTPLAGEFQFQSAISYGDEVGPVRLLAAPVMEDATEQEVVVARQAIEATEIYRSNRIDIVADASFTLIREVSALATSDEAPGLGSAVTDLADALHARDLNRTDRTDGYVVLGAERLLRELDNIGHPSTPAYDALSRTLDAAECDGVHATLSKAFEEAHLYAALAMGRLRGMGLLPTGHDQERQDEFEARTLAPMFVGAAKRSDTFRMGLAGRAADELDACDMLARGARPNVPIAIQSVLAMSMEQVRDCLNIPSDRDGATSRETTHGGARTIGGLLGQASKLEPGGAMVASKRRRHADPVDTMIADRRSDMGR